MADYLMNCWYGLLWSQDLKDQPVAQTVLDMKVVVFRDSDGRPAAMLDRCPHRFAPLSLGRVVDGVLQCGYHGLGFDRTGRCVSNIMGAAPSAQVRAFPVEERYQMIWFWPGDPEACDPELIPEFNFHDEAEGDHWVIFGYSHIKSDYQNETDNLMDLSHIETLHLKTFGGRSIIQRGELEIRDLGSEIHANWWMPDIPEIHATTMKPTGEMIDQFLDMRWNAPCNMRLHVGLLPAGKYRDRASGLREDLPGQRSCHIITPETDGTCHYFWSAERPTTPGEHGDAEGGRAFFKLAFEVEDKPMLEAVQSNMTTDFWSERPVILPNDAGGVRARRRLAKMILDEKRG